MRQIEISGPFALFVVLGFFLILVVIIILIGSALLFIAVIAAVAGLGLYTISKIKGLASRKKNSQKKYIDVEYKVR